MTNADRLTPYEHETTNKLIAGLRRQLEATHGGRAHHAFCVMHPCETVTALLSALEASQAQAARNIDLLSQVARLRAHMRCIAQACQEHGGATAVAQQALQDGQYPADLLAAVRVIVIDDSYKADRRAAVATLVRYGLLPVADG